MPTVDQPGNIEELQTSTRGPACFGCRKRSKKCDRARPECRNCTARGLRCEGYPPKYRFRLENAITRKTPQEVLAGRAATATATILPPSESLPNSSSRGEGAPCRSTSDDDRHSARQASEATDWEPTESPRDERPNLPKTSNLPAFIAPKDEVLALPQSQRLLSYYDEIVCDAVVIVNDRTLNPFREHILPLAYQNAAVLQSILLLSAHHELKCTTHGISTDVAHNQGLADMGEALSRSLQSTSPDDKTILVVTLHLALDDMYGTGVAAAETRAYLSQTSAVCEKLAAKASLLDPCEAFLVAAHTWIRTLSLIFALPKTTFTRDPCTKVISLDNQNIDELTGCPKMIFSWIIDTLWDKSRYSRGEISRGMLHEALMERRHVLKTWDVLDGFTSGPKTALEKSFQHACLLLILGMLPRHGLEGVVVDENIDVAEEIMVSISTILDTAARIPENSSSHKKVLIPLCIAGFYTTIPHQQHYIELSIQEIAQQTGCSDHLLWKSVAQDLHVRRDAGGSLSSTFQWQTSGNPGPCRSSDGQHLSTLDEQLYITF
ncbi:fungal-specific transcription factor domain-containing protein [Exophiala viscosa]|uniref:Fungal-specific transcription factor domain-containing protein n=1 Tax=Exophiala viscosa TaxID=2486360 RepID=A0AAN6IAQ8_9EURO|nr:fungal-specific transcription factor domain-containing protein [Exophiala viscosa]